MGKMPKSKELYKVNTNLIFVFKLNVLSSSLEDHNELDLNYTKTCKNISQVDPLERLVELDSIMSKFNDTVIYDPGKKNIYSRISSENIPP